MGEWIYTCRTTFSWPWHLLEVSGQVHTPVTLPQGKGPWCPLDTRLGGPQSQSRQHGEHSWPYWDSNSNPSIIQPVASHYTNYAIQSHFNNISYKINLSLKNKMNRKKQRWGGAGKEEIKMKEEERNEGTRKKTKDSFLRYLLSCNIKKRSLC
jgi:hypothetical protein